MNIKSELDGLMLHRKSYTNRRRKDKCVWKSEMEKRASGGEEERGGGGALQSAFPGSESVKTS